LPHLERLGFPKKSFLGLCRKMSYNQQYLVAAQMGHQQVQVQHQATELAHQQAAQLELAGGQPANTNALAIRRPFDPRAHDLDAHFRLTRFADLKG